MTKEQVKAFCKYAIENGNKPLNEMQKELLKQGIDHAHNFEELLLMLITYLKM